MGVNEKKKKVMTCFIEATEDLMKEDDIDKISIRKIAKRATTRQLFTTTLKI